MAKRAPRRSWPSATEPRRSACPVVTARIHAVSSRRRAALASPERRRRSASAVSRSTRSASGQPAPVSATASRTRARWPAASAKANRRVSASAATRAHHRAGSEPNRGTPAARWPASSAGNTSPPRACRSSSAVATRACSSRRRVGPSVLAIVSRYRSWTNRPSATRPAAVAASTSSVTRAGAIPVTSASTPGRSSVLATAAASSSSAQPAGSRATRWRTTSRTAVGISVAPRPAASKWHTSRARNGWPPLRSTTTGIQSGRVADPPIAVTSSATSPAASARNAIGSATAASSATPTATAGSSSCGRYAPTSSTGAPPAGSGNG